jgi:translation initiation factor 4G
VSREALSFLVETLFEKAWAEAKYTSMYAHLCMVLKERFEGHLFEGESPSKRSQNWFKYLLLVIIQREFDSNLDSAKNEEIDTRQIKKKNQGNVRFIGELLKVRIITAKIIQTIVEELIKLEEKDPNSVDEHKIEVACVLISTAGHFFEKKKLVRDTNKIFAYLNEILEVNKTMSSKVRFRIMVLGI